MKVHYFNIFLFSLTLKIILLSSEVYNQRNHYITRTPKATTRTLCECELYAPSNYDNDPEMKAVMQGFDRQTSQRFEEYNERMMKNRQKCKEQCEKDIQKIILKDKLEKQMEQQLTTLDPNITTEDIPTCICEKSLADKTEKFCLNCGKTMGGVAPGWGLVGGLWYASWTHFVATKVSKAAADAGVKKAIEGLGEIYGLSTVPGVDIPGMVNAENFQNIMHLIESVMCVQNNFCTSALNETNLFCSTEVNMTSTVFTQGVSHYVTKTAEAAGQAAKAAKVAEAAKFVPKTTILTNTIIASIVAIIVIVLVMAIIYLILRYRRKKKMKKKLEYIKLLKE